MKNSGAGVGAIVGVADGPIDGAYEGLPVGRGEGPPDGADEGAGVGAYDGADDGTPQSQNLFVDARRRARRRDEHRAGRGRRRSWWDA